ncbi:hypothetical protein PI125_g13271 [Phytophthora idaei]|nr:hypothetical protein PI125_g13271 [Phytophthora idaei]KAG3149456.1 hypothetical protein PI126_g11997 [Phytophthora idaei]
MQHRAFIAFSKIRGHFTWKVCGSSVCVSHRYFLQQTGRKIGPPIDLMTLESTASVHPVPRSPLALNEPRAARTRLPVLEWPQQRAHVSYKHRQEPSIHKLQHIFGSFGKVGDDLSNM